MSGKLLIFTGSAIIASGIGGLGIMLYKNSLSTPIKTKKSIIKKIKKKKVLSTSQKLSKLSKSNNENKDTEQKTIVDSKESLSVNSKNEKDSISFSTKDISNDDLEEEDFKDEVCVENEDEECVEAICETDESNKYFCYVESDADEIDKLE